MLYNVVISKSPRDHVIVLNLGNYWNSHQNCKAKLYRSYSNNGVLMLRKLKFLDGYVSNLGRCVDLSRNKMYGIKSHDCHIFMQRLIPITFHELLPENVWQALTELSIFFKDLTATLITEDDMKHLEEDLPIMLCKLERIFSPSFFDSMEHLPVHLAYEVRIVNPVQYRWMYSFEQ